MRIFLAFAFITCCYFINAQKSISLEFDASYLENSTTKIAIEDCKQLLQKSCNCHVSFNNHRADLRIQIPLLDSTILQEELNSHYPVSKIANSRYSWKSAKNGKQLMLELTAFSYEGIASGLYGLLQEKLGFKFVHTRETVVPDQLDLVTIENLDWTAEPRFNKRGFHLHTMHPLELTEQLLDENYPNALHDVKEYIDWLARNGQNYFEFNLQEDVNRKGWIPHAKAIVEYAHQRGILVGVDLSLHMIQQKAFQLYKSSVNKKKQIDKNMTWLNQVPWDQWSMEFSKTEFNSGNVKKKMELQLYVTKQLTEKYGIKLMGRKHVVKASAELGKGKSHKVYEMTEEEKTLDTHRGVLMHTVMFYSSVEEKAPVYRNENLRHIYEGLLEEKKVRETWYYPESAYWITFDNSVPMTLLPYLNARLEDIKVMDSLGVEGHLTFSSGWEWNYWMIDWSIARWSWSHTNNGKMEANYPMEYVHEIFPNNKKQNRFNEIQQFWIKELEIIRFLCPSSVTDEFPSPYNLEFQPRPRLTYKYIRRKANSEELLSMQQEGVERLLAFADQMDIQLKTIDSIQNNALWQEYVDGLKITSLRARHRANTLAYIIALRNAELINKRHKDALVEYEYFLKNAESIRSEAQEIVNRREQNYRYPVESLAREHKSNTAYEFGYLYPVSNLHFWKREEIQATKNKWSPFYMNIFDLMKIIGLKN